MNFSPSWWSRRGWCGLSSQGEWICNDQEEEKFSCGKKIWKIRPHNTGLPPHLPDVVFIAWGLLKTCHTELQPHKRKSKLSLFIFKWGTCKMYFMEDPRRTGHEESTLYSPHVFMSTNLSRVRRENSKRNKTEWDWLCVLLCFEFFPPYSREICWHEVNKAMTLTGLAGYNHYWLSNLG